MPPKKPTPRNDELFRSQLDNMIDMGHALVKLARLIDWSRFDDAYGRFYHEKGRPGLSTRLMAGLHLLKHMEGLSDEAVCARWVENPYFQYFCGEQYFRHKLPLDRSSMTRWRGRIGADKLELLLAEMLRIAMETRAMPPQACERVTVDTTVQTKAVAHPTDIVSNDDNLTYGAIVSVHTGPDEAITALTDHGVEELTDMFSQARLTTKAWHQFLDDFVNDPELATRFKADKLR